MAASVKSKQPLVSVIIPVYNCEEYIQKCLDSIYSQSYDSFEIIVVDDGSTDGSLRILRQNAKKHSNITLIEQANKGQGFTRNHALKLANGEYVLFVDADDYIEPQTLELAVVRAEKDNADVVHFDWKMLRMLPGGITQLHYFNVEPFAGESAFQGDECDRFMDMNNYFSVNNLYRRSFLNQHSIRYDEGHIYEDVLFIVQVANKATHIAFIHEPLYVVRKNLASTTHSDVKTDKHYKDFLRAVKKSFEQLSPRTPFSTYYLAGYFLEKFIIYYQQRVPVRLRVPYTKDFIDSMSHVKVVIPTGGVPKRFLEMCLAKDIFSQRKYRTFRLLLLYKTVIASSHQSIKDFLRHKVGKKSVDV